MKFAVVALLSLAVAVRMFAKTHNDTYPVPCSELWQAVQDTIKKSGKYSLVVADNTQMTVVGRLIKLVLLGWAFWFGVTMCDARMTESGGVLAEFVFEGR